MSFLRKGLGDAPEKQRGEMNMQLATVTESKDADALVRVGSVFPVFVDGTGRRRKLVILLGWLVAVACVAYLGVIGISMTGTSVGPLPEIPSVASKSVVFGSDAEALPQGVLELPVPAPVLARQVQAPAPSVASSSRSPVRMKGTSR
jgi:hypothetical protein